MGSPYTLLYSRAFDRDLDVIPAYDAVTVEGSDAAVVRLKFRGRKTTEEMGK